MIFYRLVYYLMCSVRSINSECRRVIKCVSLFEFVGARLDFSISLDIYCKFRVGQYSQLYCVVYCYTLILHFFEPCLYSDLVRC